MNAEAKVAAQPRKIGDVCLRVMAEAEGLAFVDLDGVKPGMQDTGSEVLGGPMSKLFVEGKHEDQI